MAFICAKAGGLASTGSSDILDIVPKEIHARSPIVLGSLHDVEDYIRYQKESTPPDGDKEM